LADGDGIRIGGNWVVVVVVVAVFEEVKIGRLIDPYPCADETGMLP
jgi:hypothetical protein